MTASLVHKTLFFILLSLALSLSAAAPSAYADVPDEKVIHAPAVRVNCCHPTPQVETRQFHDSNRNCHNHVPQPRDLNVPEYRQGHQVAYLLIKEPRTPDPQSHAGQSFEGRPASETQLHSPSKVSHASLQSQICLRSDVLLH